jgi:hypothetical protein
MQGLTILTGKYEGESFGGAEIGVTSPDRHGGVFANDIAMGLIAKPCVIQLLIKITNYNALKVHLRNSLFELQVATKADFRESLKHVT